MPELVEGKIHRVWDKFRKVYEYILKGSPYISPR